MMTANNGNFFEIVDCRLHFAGQQRAGTGLVGIVHETVATCTERFERSHMSEMRYDTKIARAKHRTPAFPGYVSMENSTMMTVSF